MSPRPVAGDHPPPPAPAASSLGLSTRRADAHRRWLACTVRGVVARSRRPARTTTLRVRPGTVRLTWVVAQQVVTAGMSRSRPQVPQTGCAIGRELGADLVIRRLVGAVRPGPVEAFAQAERPGRSAATQRRSASWARWVHRLSKQLCTSRTRTRRPCRPRSRR